MPIVHPHHLVVLLLVVAGCKPPIDFGSDRESKSLTYSQYLKMEGVPGLDPVGASDIYYRYYSTIDGYDEWWRFTISKNDSDQLAAVVSRDNYGPNEIEWDGSTGYPTNWRPDDSSPQWWTFNDGHSAMSVHWCHDSGSTDERANGWYFLYNPDSQLMYGWHWNHQWSSSVCTSPLSADMPEPSDEREPE